MEQLPPPPQEKELPAPHEKLLRKPTFWERQGKIAKWLTAGSIIFFILLLVSTLLLRLLRPTIIQLTQPVINAIEISTDKKSILTANTQKIIFTIEEAKTYLEKSGYAYNPDTFQTTNTKYAGECFSETSLSNKKDRIVFSTGCLPGDLPQPWIGIYNLPSTHETEYYMPFKFLTSGGGRNFVWSQDDATITYEADLGLSGLTEPRTIDSNTGKILNKESGSSKSYYVQKETIKNSNPKIISKKITLTIKNYSLDNGQIKIAGMDQKISFNEPILPTLNLDKEILPPAPITDNSKDKEIKVIFDNNNSKNTILKNKIPIGDIATTGVEIKGKFSYQGFWPAELYHTYSTFTLGAESKEVGFYTYPVQYNSETGETKIWTTMVFDVEYNLAN